MEQQRRARSPTVEAGNDLYSTAERPFARTAAFVAGSAPAGGGPAVELTKGTQVGEYAIETKIGEGAMGTVYRAVHPAIGKKVAIKVMTPKLFDEPESVKRFVAEARAVAAIRHPGIVDVFGFGRLPDNRTYLVMEWLDGMSLDAQLRKGKLALEDACDMLRQIARALEAAHSKGVVHRDLKPENVFILHIDDEKPQCKLLDFGLAKVTNKEDGMVAKTRTGQLLGTPLYMSPEQCKSKGVDHRTDIYALGCMAYEMLCGRVPFDADNVAELISAHLMAEPPKPTSFRPDLPPALDKLLLQMIAKNPDDRPTLADVRKQISSVLNRQSQPIDSASIPDDITPPPRPAGGFSTGSQPAIVVPASGEQRTSSAKQPEPKAPDLETTMAVRKSGGTPWPAIIGVIVIVAIALALLVTLR